MTIRSYDGTVRHAGAVLACRERSYRDDSDFYAIVWDGKELTSVEYATTRFGGGGSAQEDATPETLAAAGAWAFERAWRAILSESLDEAARPAVGKTVEILSGKNKGKTGRVFWQGANQFRTYYRNGYNRPEADYNQRLGIRTETSETLWTGFRNVRVLDPEEHAIDEESARQAAERFRTDPVGWYLLGSSIPVWR